MSAAAVALHAFEARSPRGSLQLQLQLPNGDGADDAVAAALALAAAEPLLAELEQWLEIAIDPLPCKATGRSPGELCARVHDSALAPLGSLLRMPIGIVPQGRRWPAALEGLAWDTLRFELELDRFATTPLPRDAWNTGGILLLPASFDAPWRVRLVERQVGIEMPATWAGPGSPVQLAGAAAIVVDEHRDDWRVLLASSVCMEPAQCFGIEQGAGAASPCAALDAPDAGALLIAPRRDMPLAQGALVPALRGTGLWIAPPDGGVTQAAGELTSLQTQPA